MKTVAQWIVAYWWLSWLIPTAIMVLWIGGAVLFFLFVTVGTWLVKLWDGTTRRIKGTRRSKD
jgi:hypothetical protein